MHVSISKNHDLKVTAHHSVIVKFLLTAPVSDVSV